MRPRPYGSVPRNVQYIKLRSGTCQGYLWLPRPCWVRGQAKPGSAPGGVAHGAPPLLCGRTVGRVGFSPRWCCAWCASFGVRADGGPGGVQPQVVLRMVRLLWCAGGRWAGWGSAPGGVAHGVPPLVCGRTVGRVGFSPRWCCAWCASFGVRADGGPGGVQPQVVLRMVCLLCCAGGRWAGWGSAPGGVAHGVPPLLCGRTVGRVGFSPRWCCAWCASFAVRADGGPGGVQPQVVLRMVCLLWCAGGRWAGWGSAPGGVAHGAPPLLCTRLGIWAGSAPGGVAHGAPPLGADDGHGLIGIRFSRCCLWRSPLRLSSPSAGRDLRTSQTCCARHVVHVPNVGNIQYRMISRPLAGNCRLRQCLQPRGLLRHGVINT